MVGMKWSELKKCLVRTCPASGIRSLTGTVKVKFISLPQALCERMARSRIYVSYISFKSCSTELLRLLRLIFFDGSNTWKLMSH